MRVRTEVFGSLTLSSSHHHRSWPLFIEGQGKKWVAFVVTQTDIETRSMLFDEVELQHQSFYFVTYLNPFHSGSCSHHGRSTRMQDARLLEVIRQPLPEVFSFTNVNYFAVCVTKLVRPRRFGNRTGRWFSNHALLLSSNFRFGF